MRGIVRGQRIEAVKKERAKQLRREMTPAEAVFWKMVRGRRCLGLKFRRQQFIRGFIVDFYCEEHGLIVEIDGPIHERQKDVDRARDEVLAGLGLVVLRIKNAILLEDLERVSQMLSEAIALRRSSPSPSGEGARG